MRRHPVGFRYATAMFEHAKENKKLDQTLEELQVVSQVLDDTKLLDEVFKHPKVSNDVKKDIIKEVFTSQVSDAIINLLYILVDRKREEAIFSITDNFKALVNEEQGVAEATVITAKPLNEEEKSAITDVFKNIAGKQKLLIENVIDKDIIGGLKVRIGDRIYDGSVANQLDRIQQRMIFGNVSR
ncbi:F0F1 ATP synthase subunit delta [Evansella halocellulosilytica]|uniref:F0F1 ATP synthase subunit delta n=1 Tax=Evansella halocellulosilytica TaxID=2011013 RepID=UPI000BB6E88B|nr:F0F1 ATP synthase subunit delta [Evansella halocellulosilytica]